MRRLSLLIAVVVLSASCGSAEGDGSASAGEGDAEVQSVSGVAGVQSASGDGEDSEDSETTAALGGGEASEVGGESGGGPLAERRQGSVAAGDEGSADGLVLVEDGGADNDGVETAATGPTGDPDALALLESTDELVAGRSVRTVDTVQISFLGISVPMPVMKSDYGEDGSFSMVLDLPTSEALELSVDSMFSLFADSVDDESRDAVSEKVQDELSEKMRDELLDEMLAIYEDGGLQDTDIRYVDSAAYLKLTPGFAEAMGLDAGDVLSGGPAWFTISPELFGVLMNGDIAACAEALDGGVATVSLVNARAFTSVLANTVPLLNTNTQDSDCEAPWHAGRIDGLMDFVVDARIVGSERVRGVDTTKVSFKLSDSIYHSVEGELYDLEEGSVSDYIRGTYVDAYFDADGLLRQMVIDMKGPSIQLFGDDGDSSVGDSDVTVVLATAEFYDWDADITIEAPPAELLVGHLDLSDFPDGFNSDWMFGGIEDDESDQLAGEYTKAGDYTNEFLCMAAGFEWLPVSQECVSA